MTAPFPDSLCHRCAHHRIVQAARSAFVMCGNPELPKYPRQPVVTCPGFAEAPR